MKSMIIYKFVDGRRKKEGRKEGRRERKPTIKEVLMNATDMQIGFL